MQVEIEKLVKQVEIIEIDLPYYYKHDLFSDYGDIVIYGKIEENSCTCIEEKIHGDEEAYRIEKDAYNSIKNSGRSCYFEKTHKSNKEEYEQVKLRCLSFLNKF